MHGDRSIQVGAAQINPILGDVGTNSTFHLDSISDARARGLDVLVFPELSLTGYCLQRKVMAVSMTREDPQLLQLAAATGSMYCLVGFVEEAGPGEFYNALALLHEGAVIHVHRKVNLPTYGGLEEGKWFTPGEGVSITPINPGWSISQWLCADLWNPGLVYAAMIKRPTLMCASINSASGIVSAHFSNEENWILNLSFYAMTYGTPVVMANRYGPEGEHHFWGGSCIMGPTGEILAKADDRCMLVHAEVSLDDVALARFELPTHRDANNRLIERLLHDAK